MYGDDHYYAILETELEPKIYFLVFGDLTKRETLKIVNSFYDNNAAYRDCAIMNNGLKYERANQKPAPKAKPKGTP